MPETPIPIFLNGTPLRVVPGASLGEVLATHDPELLAALLGGSAHAVDGRGIALDPDRGLGAGSIVRVIRSARGDGAADA